MLILRLVALMAESSAFLGIDTSCYTTSVAAVDTLGNIITSERIGLEVKKGSRGLRQSEGVFAHVRNFPIIFARAMEKLEGYKLSAVCVSSSPVDGKESYMPVFIAGKSFAESIAQSLDIPCYYTTHQMGHLRAALFGNEHIKEPFVALHLSGGTSDFMLYEKGKFNLFAKSLDLHFGQLVDRVGVAMGLPFPSGVQLEKLALGIKAEGKYPATVREDGPCLSGAEKQAMDDIARGDIAHSQIAAEIYDCLYRSIIKTLNGFNSGELPVLVFGGVASSGILRNLLNKSGEYSFNFADAALSGDNAVGVALIAMEKYLYRGDSDG